MSVTTEKHTEFEINNISAARANQNKEENEKTLSSTQDIKSLKEGPGPASIVIHDKPESLDVATAVKKRPWWKFWKKRSSLDELPDPRQFSLAKKYSILLIIALAGASSPISSSVYLPALTYVQKDFQTSDTAVNASVSLFIFMSAIFPLPWASWSDVYGRKNIYLISFAISIVGNICCAVSVNIAMLIVFRGVSAVGTCSVMSMGAGTLADVFDSHERGRAYSWYVLGPIVGPAIGPIVGGYLTEGFGWRATFAFVAAFTACNWLSIFFFLPETFRPQKEPEKKQKSRISNPLQALSLLRFINVFIAVWFLGIMFGVYYLVNTTFAWTFANQYHLDSGTTGLCYLPLAFGGMLGGNLGGRISDYVYSRNLRKKGPNAEPVPEMRLSVPVLSGACLLNLGALSAYGWSIQENLHYAAPICFCFLEAFCIMLPHVTLTAYLVDCHKTRSASVTACNNLLRYLLAGVGSLLSSDLMRALGTGPLFTGCGVIILIFGAPMIFVKKNPQMWKAARERANT